MHSLPTAKLLGLGQENLVSMGAKIIWANEKALLFGLQLISFMWCPNNVWKENALDGIALVWTVHIKA